MYESIQTKRNLGYIPLVVPGVIAAGAAATYGMGYLVRSIRGTPEPAYQASAMERWFGISPAVIVALGIGGVMFLMYRSEVEKGVRGVYESARRRA